MLKSLLLALIFAVAADCADETQCQKITPDTNIDLKEDKRWYYCKSGDNNRYCIADLAALDDKTINNTITHIDMKTNKPMVFNYNLDEQDKKGVFYYPEAKIYGTVSAVTEDKQCFTFMKCTQDKKVVYLFLCSKTEQCMDEKYKPFLEEQVKKTEGVVPVDEMKNSYETCKAAGVF